MSLHGPLIFNIFLNDIFYFVSKGNLYNYADDNCTSVSHQNIRVLSPMKKTHPACVVFFKHIHTL